MKLIKRAERKNNVIGEAILMPVPEGVIPVDLWKPEDQDIYAGYQGKVLFIAFDKIFGRDIIHEYNFFDISLKEAYYKQLDVISLYINYFLKFYDEDKELIMAYMKLKYMIDAKHITELKRNSMIKAIQKILFSDSICEKIKRMSMDNYRVDLTTEVKTKKTSNKSYAPVMQFNEHHAEILMRISVAIKFAIPVILHYIKTYYNKKLNRYEVYKADDVTTVKENKNFVTSVKANATLLLTIDATRTEYTKDANNVITAKDAIITIL